MSIRAKDLSEYIVKPVLQKLGLYSVEAETLLMLTAAVESKLGYHLHQEDGPALGIYQIEPKTHGDVWRYLNTRNRYDTLRDIINDMRGSSNDEEELIWNLAYATAICRIKYYMVPEPIPPTLTRLAIYWKQYYNTPSGKGSTDKAVWAYNKYVLNDWNRYNPRDLER